MCVCECRDNYWVNIALRWALMDAIDDISQHSALRGTGWHGLEHAFMMAMRFSRVFSCHCVGFSGFESSLVQWPSCGGPQYRSVASSTQLSHSASS